MSEKQQQPETCIVIRDVWYFPRWHSNS